MHRVGSMNTENKDFWERLVSCSCIIFDFDGVFTDNFVYVSEDGIEHVRCSRLDGLGLYRIRSLGLPMVVMSTEKNPVVRKRCSKLEIECFDGLDDKVQAAVEWSKKNNLDLSKAVFVGNDINDIPLLSSVGFPVGVADCSVEIIPYIQYQLTKRGGDGAVRELCDIVLKLKNNQ